MEPSPAGSWSDDVESGRDRGVLTTIPREEGPAAAHQSVDGGIGRHRVHSHTQLLLNDKGMATDQFGGKYSAVPMETSKGGHLVGLLLQLIHTGAGCLV